MVPIALNSGNELDEISFKERILSICKTQKKQQKALAFVFLVYDFDDHTINKILKDEDYWSSLDKISGKALSIFYLNSQNNYFKKRQIQLYNSEMINQNRAANSGFVSYMVPLSMKPTPLDNSVSFLKSTFSLSDELGHPFALFFQTNDEDDISDSFIVNLKQEKIEDAFLEIRTLIKNAVDAVSSVEPKNFGNHQEVFLLIKEGIQAGKFSKFIKTNVISKISLGTIFSLIKLLIGAN